MAEWSIAFDCKSNARKGYVGSNPAPSTVLNAEVGAPLIRQQVFMYYVYVLYSEKDKHLYIGSTPDLKKRILKHNTGRVRSTKNRRPLKLIYYEACLNKDDVFHREKYLKTYLGKQFLHNRLKSYLTG